MGERKSWSEIRAGAGPETLAQAACKTAEMLREMPVHEVPQLRRLQNAQAQEELGRPSEPGSAEL